MSVFVGDEGWVAARVEDLHVPAHPMTELSTGEVCGVIGPGDSVSEMHLRSPSCVDRFVSTQDVALASDAVARRSDGGQSENATRRLRWWFGPSSNLALVTQPQADHASHPQPAAMATPRWHHPSRPLPCPHRALTTRTGRSHETDVRNAAVAGYSVDGPAPAGVRIADRRPTALFDVSRRVGTAGRLDIATATAELTEVVESGASSIQLAGEREEPFISLLFTKSPRFGSGIRGYFVDTDVSALTSKVHDLLDVVDAYVVRIEGREPVGGQINARVRQAMAAASRQFGGSPGPHWPTYLLCGLSYRTFLSDELVHFLGAELIAALPEERAWREKGRWLIAGIREPVQLPPDDYDPQERETIEALDAMDAFFNPLTGDLPTRVPELEAAPTARFWTDGGFHAVAES